MTSAVLEHVVAAIGPASAAHAELARQRIGAMGGPAAVLAVRLAAAQHVVRLRVARRALIVVAADHGVGAPGIELGDDHPTAVALRAMAAGDGALAGLARAAGATLVLVDAGCAGTGVPASAVRVELAPSGDYLDGAAMRPADVLRGIEAGIALAVALADDGVEVIGVGRLGLGGEDAAAALIEALTAGARRAPSADDALARLAEIGGGDTAVLAGVVLAAASMTVPVILDGHETLAAALIARALAPAVVDALVAGQAGSAPVARAALAALGLEPVVAAGIGTGEGAGAAMVMSLVPAAAALLA